MNNILSGVQNQTTRNRTKIMTSPTASAEARGLARAAKTYEGAGDLDSARKHYLLAAKR